MQDFTTAEANTVEWPRDSDTCEPRSSRLSSTRSMTGSAGFATRALFQIRTLRPVLLLRTHCRRGQLQREGLDSHAKNLPRPESFRDAFLTEEETMATLPKPAPITTDEQAIRSITLEFVQYHEARNIEKLVSLFTNDGRVMAPFRPLVQGKANLRQIFQAVFDEFDQRNLKVDTTHVEVCGDAAFSMGTFKVNLKIPTGKRIDDQGKWLVAMRREGNTWKIVAHCWNTDLPITTFMS